jgi:hypothetical protein
MLGGQDIRIPTTPGDAMIHLLLSPRCITLVVDDAADPRMLPLLD